MKRFTAAAIALLMALLFCGCSSLLNTEYVTVKPHSESYEALDESDVITVENYNGLKNAILGFVEAGMEYGVIRSYSYDGDVTQDLASAAYEVARNDPLGAYAIDYLSHDYTRIVSYYELHIYLTYRHTMEEIQSVVRVSGETQEREKIAECLEASAEKITLRYSYYDDTDYQSLINEICEDEPILSIGYPEAEVNTYPETGVQRIVEINFSYSLPVSVVTFMKEKTVSAIEELKEAANEGNTPEERSYILFKDLSSEVTLKKPTDDKTQHTSTLYNCLVSGNSDDFGIAQSYFVLCRDMGIECCIVSGSRNGEEHFWNIVDLGDKAFHVDIAATIEDGGIQYYCLNDEQMTGYLWDKEDYPPCDYQPEVALQEVIEAE